MATALYNCCSAAAVASTALAVAVATNFPVAAEVADTAEIYSAAVATFVTDAAVNIAVLTAATVTVTFDVAQLLISVAATANASSFSQ